MYFHPELGPAPKVGLEVEVVEWKTPHNMLSVAKELEEAGFMPAGVYSVQRHEYHCRTCKTCVNIGADSGYPIMWKMQRDASLPSKTGAEFVSSPFPADSNFVENAMEAIRIIGREAVWRLDRDSENIERGDPRAVKASPGLHIHTYAAGPQIAGMDLQQIQKAIDGYHAFLPELFTLAQANLPGYSRGLDFRLPTRDLEAHHAFLAVAGRRYRYDQTLRLEWRLFEIAYEDPDYIEGAIYLSAAMTQLTQRRKAFRQFAAIGDLIPWRDDGDDEDKPLDVLDIVQNFNPERFEILKEAVLNGTALRDDKPARSSVESLFDRVG